MYDHIKAWIPIKHWDYLYSFTGYNMLIDTYKKEDLGVTSKKEFYHNGMKITFFENNEIRSIIISGSVHFYKNENKHNADDFSIVEFYWVLEDLGKLLNIDWSECKLMMFEYGINIVPPIPSIDILNGCMIHKSKRFNIKNDGHYLEVAHQRYFFKIYDKRYWCRDRNVQLPKTRLLRIEIKTRRMEDYNKAGIIYVSDLLKIKSIDFLSNKLRAFIDDLVLYDLLICKEELSKDFPRAKVQNFNNPNYWIGLVSLKGKSEKEINTKRIQFKRNKNKMDSFSISYGCSLKDNLKSLISKKTSELNCTQINHVGKIENVPKLTT